MIITITKASILIICPFPRGLLLTYLISPQSNVSILLFIPVYQILCCPVTVATLVDQTKRETT